MEPASDRRRLHSEQYGVLRSGQALTPFLLHTLLSVPEDICPRPEGGVEKALAFIRRHVDDNGAIGHADPDIVEYPIYSTSYALQCLLAAQDNPDRSDAADRQTIRRMVQFLTSAQYHEANGFATTHPATVAGDSIALLRLANQATWTWHIRGVRSTRSGPTQ